jgi:hypothetical protein
MQHLLRLAKIGHIYQLKRVLAVDSAELATLLVPQNADEI